MATTFPKTGSKLEDVLAALSAAIGSGRLAPGQRLVEGTMAQEFGVSRSLLRESFRQLAADGALELVPNRGALVRRLSRRDALELFEIRTELEALAARRAAAAMADPALRRRFEQAAAMLWSDRAMPDAAVYIAENERFHTAILAASGNEQLLQISRRLQLALILAQVRDALTAETLALSISEHREIARAILAGDGAGAEAAARAHLARASRFLLGLPESLFRPA